jgi:lipid II:glycine glycyltransferase (peptidoglycan interpeptide bridge formation enzyme)
MEIATEVSTTEWRDFIDRTPGGNIFQGPDMARVYKQTKGYEPHVVASLQGGSINGLLASVIVSHRTGRLSRLASRAIAVGGPIGDPATFPSLLVAHDEHTEKRALLTQVRNLIAPRDLTPFASVGYRWEDHLNFVVNLNQSEEKLLSGMSKARRRGIERAARSGLELVDLKREQLPFAYALLQETSLRARVPLADRSLFENALTILGGAGKLWVLGAWFSDRLCAVRFVLNSKKTLFDWYAGSSDLGRSNHADEWLVWQVFRRGIQNGFYEFDFGGAGPPDSGYGPGEFKRRFGGQSVAPGRFVKTYHPIALMAAKTLFRIWKGRT